MRDKNITITVSTEAYRQARICGSPARYFGIRRRGISHPNLARNLAGSTRLPSAPAERSSTHSAKAGSDKLSCASFASETVKPHLNHSK